MLYEVITLAENVLVHRDGDEAQGAVLAEHAPAELGEEIARRERRRGGDGGIAQDGDPTAALDASPCRRRPAGDRLEAGGAGARRELAPRRRPRQLGVDQLRLA